MLPMLRGAPGSPATAGLDGRDDTESESSDESGLEWMSFAKSLGSLIVHGSLESHSG